MAIETEQIMKKLELIKSELDYIKENMIPIDAVLTKEDKVALEKAREEYKKGKTTSFERLKKELGM